MRKLKQHEQKMLKHSNLYDWDDNNEQVVAGVMRKYGIERREQLVQYRSTARKLRTLVEEVSKLPKEDEIRIQLTQRLQALCYELKISDDSREPLAGLAEFAAARLMRRRLPVVLHELKMAPTMNAALTFVKHGHVRIGPDVVQNINLHVGRVQEDYVTWRDDSAIRKKIQHYNGDVDDFQI